MYDVNEQLKDALTNYPDYEVVTESNCTYFKLLSKVTIDTENKSVVLIFEHEAY